MNNNIHAPPLRQRLAAMARLLFAALHLRAALKTLVIGLVVFGSHSAYGDQRPISHSGEGVEKQEKSEKIQQKGLETLTLCPGICGDPRNGYEDMKYEHAKQGHNEWDERNIAAQERIAAWTQKMGFIAFVSLLATIIGVVLLSCTLVYTARAAEYARKMVVEAEKTTAAAQASIIETRNIGIAETRSYVSVAGGGYILNHSGFSGWCDIINSGNTPALDTVLTFELTKERAWFGGAMMGSAPESLEVAPKTAQKPKIQPRETSRYYFVWTAQELGEKFAGLSDEKFTLIVTCKMHARTVYDGIDDSGTWQLTNHPEFVRSTERSRIAEGRLHPRQLQTRH